MRRQTAARGARARTKIEPTERQARARYMDFTTPANIVATPRNAAAIWPNQPFQATAKSRPRLNGSALAARDDLQNHPFDCSCCRVLANPRNWHTGHEFSCR